MRKQVAVITLATLALPLLFLACSISESQSESVSIFAAKPTPTATATPAAIDDSVNRPTSEVYTGDLSDFDKPDRADKLQIHRVMDILRIQPDRSVADIGAGSGWFTILAAKRVGEKGRVFAVEINQDYIKLINERAKKEGFSNVVTVLGSEDDPKLTAGSVDAVLILNTYHEIAQPVRFLRNLRAPLREGARVGIIDRNGTGGNHGVAKDTVIEEARRAGFVLFEEYDFVNAGRMDYFLVFQMK